MTTADAAMTDLVVDFTDRRVLDPLVAGQKAAQLARLSTAGFNVPRSLVIPANVCRRWPGRADAILARIEAELPGALAVRSSSVAEDLHGASFAGIYATVLDVEGPEALRQAIDTVIASARGDSVRAYDGEGAPMAVLVQQLVRPDAAGVAFTADPITGDVDVVVVSAVRGLGEALVAGEVDPEEWEVRRGAARCRQDPRVLDDAQARQVAAFARRVEAHDGEPRDIEWALRGGELWLLQARPITALPVPPDLPDLGPGTWMKDGAHFSEPLTPFGASTYLPAVMRGMQAGFAEFGMLIEGLDARTRGGEVYARVIPVGGGGDGPAPPAFLLGIAARVVPALRARMRAARDAVRGGKLVSVVDEWNHVLRDRFQADADALLDEDPDALSARALRQHLDRAGALLERGQISHFRLMMPYAVAVAELAMACRELLQWEPDQALRLLIGLSPASSAPTRALADLAALAGTIPGARDLLGNLKQPEDLDGMPALAAAFRAFERRHGWRTISYDPGAPAIAERPRLLARLIADRLDRNLKGDDAATRQAAETEARERLAGRPADLARFERLLAEARRCYPLREENIALTDCVPCGLLRRAALACGRRLVADLRLQRPEDACFLRIDELRAALEDDRDTDLRSLTARRVAEHRWILAHPGPEIIGPPPAPPPNPRWLPAEGRRTNAALMWVMDQEMSPPAPSAGPGLTGRPGSPGRARGRVRIVRSEADFAKLEPGEVLVCPITSPVWSVLFGNAAALVTDAGGAMSHAAIIAREHGIPAVLATGNATARLHDGQWVTVDGTAGTVTPEVER